jgi:hypothetical protein
MSPLMKKFLFSALAMIFLFSACVPAQPTQSPDDIANQVATSVALTVAAQNAQTQAAQSAVPAATNTTLPTQTEAVVPSPTAILPTVTNTAVVLPTSSGGGGGGGVSTKPEYACDAINRRPFDNEIFRPNDTFDIRWTIVNTGTKTMQAGLDVRYSQGPELTSTKIVELPELEPGEEYRVDFDAVAPEKPGKYIMIYHVEGGLCFPYTAIVVERR